MPISTNLNISPYFDDYDQTKNFYKILFKPGVSVQTRELNQLQTLFQAQIERFGDNILKKGTIVDGCTFTFNNAQPYVKILDTELNGLTALPSLYVGNFIKNSSNLVGYIVNYADGYESTSPDLKTIYLNYINSGSNSNTKAFSAGDTLTVFSPSDGIYEVFVNDGGTNFSNNDTLIFTPKVAVALTSGSFNVGDFLIDSALGGVANLEIVEVDTLSLASLGNVLLTVKPKIEDLIDKNANSSYWTIPLNTTITNQSATVSGTVSTIFGENAQGKIITDYVGKIIDVTLLNRGSGYDYAPHMSVRSINNEAGVYAVDMTAQNYIAQVKVSSEVGAVGNGYTFSVGEGIVYQQGYFQRVPLQTVIVDKYSSFPNNVVAGFKTIENIIDSNEDTSLLDNALGTENETAPGADRLSLTPEVVIVSKDEASANVEFFTLVEWSEGNPYKQNQTTVYNRIGDEIALSNFEQSGNFVLDRFQVTTESTSNVNNEGKVYSVVVDPGQAYISGYKISTTSNYNIDVRKSLDTKVSNNVIGLNYGNYIYIKEVGGNILYNVGASIDLYTLPKGFISNTSLIYNSNTTPQGSKIGTARIRSLMHDNGVPGTANCVYRLYLFDINMNAGQNFDKVKSIYYNGTNKGIADVVLNSGKAKIFGIDEDGLIFPAGVESLKNSNNTTYTYRTLDQNIATTNTGTIVKSISTIEKEFFTAAGNLSSSALRELYVVPLANDLYQYTNLNGTVSANTTSTNVVGSSTLFDSAFEVGDYIAVNNSITDEIKRVTKIYSNTIIQVDSPFSTILSGNTYTRVFPKNVPIPFGNREGLTANIDVTRKILTLNFAQSNGQQITFRGTTSTNTALGYNVRRENITSATKVANRKTFVKIRVANNSGGTTGPWSLGVPDIFRLRNVYVANSSVNTASPTITERCYIDHNQNANYLGLGYLYINPNSRLTLKSTDYLLVEFDYFTRDDDGYFDTVSYLRTSDANTIAILDSSSLANLTTSASSWEVPEVYTFNNKYYDLLNQFDFRPAVAKTATPSLSHSTAPVNPSETVTFNVTDDKKFPVPDSVCTTQMEYYLGRVDDVYIGERGNIYVLQGIPDVDAKNRYRPNQPNDSLKLDTLAIPPYPNLPKKMSPTLAAVLNKRVVNEKRLNLRNGAHLISSIISQSEQNSLQPIVYTMKDIGNLEKRIKDLEYYVSLSVLETNITNKIIPSSVDPTINRFKFGFFADDFSTLIYSDYRSPQYAASFESEGDMDFGSFGSPTEQKLPSANTADLKAGISPTAKKKTNRIVPPKHDWVIKFSPDNIPYIDQMVIQQVYATVNTICVPNNQIINVYANTFDYYTVLSTSAKPRPSPKNDTLKMSSVAGNVVVYFYMFGASDKITIYQGNTFIAGTQQSPDQITNFNAADKAFLSSNNNAKEWYNYRTSKTDLTKNYIRAIANPDYVKYGGKIEFVHNPENGLDYTINVKRRYPSIAWKYLIKYPTTELISSTIIDVANCGIVNPNPPSPVYIGTLIVKNFPMKFTSLSKVKIGKKYPEFVVQCTGLKPNTEHKFYLDGKQLTDVIPCSWNVDTISEINKTKFGEKLITDSQGKLSFIVYFEFKYAPYLVLAALSATPDGDIYTPKNGIGIGGAGNFVNTKLTVKDTNSIA